MDTTQTLDDIEARVLGCLIEKGLATPEYYPLSLNALQNACNQKSNRDPVVSYDDMTVARALESLRQKQLVYLSGSGRVPKYGQNFTKNNNLINQEAGVIAVLMLRGPQTVSELRTRTERTSKFESLAEVNEAIRTLEEVAMMVKLPRRPGHKESRYAHLLSGEPKVDDAQYQPRPETATIEVRAENERIKNLEEEIKALREQVEQIKKEFLEFKGQFE